MPDDAEAYIEVEVKELNGSKSTVETKDGRVSSPMCYFQESRGRDFYASFEAKS